MLDKLRIGKSALAAQKFIPDHPDPAIGTSHGFHLYLYGKYSTICRDVVSDSLRSRQSRTREPSTLELINDSVDMIVACCKDWGGYEEGDKVVKYSPDKLRELLLEDEFRWLRIGAEKFIMGDEHFFPRPGKR